MLFNNLPSIAEISRNQM